MSALVAVNAFQGVMIGFFAMFLAAIVALGAWSTRSAADYLDWRPARPVSDADDEDDDVAQLLAAQNALRRRRGVPERTRGEVDADLRRTREELEGGILPGDGAQGPWRGR